MKIMLVSVITLLSFPLFAATKIQCFSGGSLKIEGIQIGSKYSMTQLDLEEKEISSLKLIDGRDAQVQVIEKMLQLKLGNILTQGKGAASIMENEELKDDREFSNFLICTSLKD